MANRTNVFLVTVAALVTIFLAAVDVTIVGTAMPTIIGALGGLPLLSWVFSAYLLTSTTTVPVYGKLADLYGRKSIFLTGLAFFVLGSALCGLSKSMLQLIIFRAVQGLGAGAVLPITLTIIGDIYSLEQRAKMQGIFSGVWGISAIIGPALGGIIVDNLSWRWVFYINLPVGILAGWMMWRYLRETVARKKPKIDFAGSAMLTLGMTLLLLAMLEGGRSVPWTSPLILGLMVLSAGLLVAFIWHESRFPEPMLPLDLFRNRLIAASSFAALLSGATIIGLSSFMPLFVQGAQGGTAMNAGAVVTPMSIGWPVAGVIAGPLVLRAGYRSTALAGMIFILGSAIMLLFISLTTPLSYLVAVMFIAGMGLGFGNTAYIISVQNSVRWERRGVVTALIQFVRSLGSSVSIALMGVIFNLRMMVNVRQIPVLREFSVKNQQEVLEVTNTLLEPLGRLALPASLRGALQLALSISMKDVFWVLLVVGVLGLAAVMLFPRGSARELAVEDDRPLAKVVRSDRTDHPEIT